MHYTEYIVKLAFMQVIMDKQQIAELLEEIAAEITISAKKAETLALVGIRSRGEILAQRLQKILMEKWSLKTDRGTLDITLYRDDLNKMGYQQPVVRVPE